MNYCTICGSLKTRKIDIKLNLFVCQNCTHFFSLPEKQEKYSEEYYLKDHENWFLHPNYEYFKKISELIHKFTQKSTYQHSTLLDVGCGKGDFLKYLSIHEPNTKLTGIDITNNVDKRIQFIQGDIMSHNFKKTYSIITAFMVIEHV
ncbi:MAG: class I SAM-dependent methyltransferase, partial [Candidatus Woesearchaeota archaeon]|nr:class I SAM-dependent methyltransferase [Candidatus Woesearchaeota archaeon]